MVHNARDEGVSLFWKAKLAVGVVKHILACFAFWAFIATISVQATAEFVTYNIAEGPISISIPSYLTVWTRETVKDSTDEYIIGVTPEELLKRMEEDNLYLCVGLDEYEIAVFIEDIGDGDMNDFSESELNHLRQESFHLIFTLIHKKYLLEIALK